MQMRLWIGFGLLLFIGSACSKSEEKAVQEAPVEGKTPETNAKIADSGQDSGVAGDKNGGDSDAESTGKAEDPTKNEGSPSLGKNAADSQEASPAANEDPEKKGVTRKESSAKDKKGVARKESSAKDKIVALGAEEPSKEKKPETDSIRKEREILERAALLAATVRKETASPGEKALPSGTNVFTKRVPVVLGGKPKPFGPPPLPISHALSGKELTEMTGQRFKPAILEGQFPTPRYNSLYYEAERGSKLGVSVQLWHEPALKDTRARYEQMKVSYPNAQETGNITNYTFFSHWGEVYHMVFMDLKRRRVAAVSTETLTPNQLFTVATRVRDRLLR